MKQLVFSILFFLIGMVAFGQDEFAKFTIAETTYEVTVNTEVIASMDAGSFVLLGPTDGKGQGLAIMIPSSEIATYELEGGYQAPMVTISVSASEYYNILEGTLEITDVKDKMYEGRFSGNAKKGSEETMVEVSGEFRVTLDM